MLRRLLVIAAGLSTILAGMREVDALPPSTDISVSALDSDALDGSREDDSGKRSEESEEDDRETKGEREIHLLATTALACTLEARGVFIDGGDHAAKPRQHGRASWIRGPPAAC